MGTSRTSILVEHVFRDTPLGKNIRVCIEDIVLDAGLYGLIWDMKFHDIEKYIECHSWVYAILKYNSKHNIRLSVDHGVMKGKRAGDCSIMSKALEYFSSVTDLRSINRIRLLFQVSSLSDICSTNGEFILQDYYLNTKSGRVCNTYDWPEKYRTSIKDFRKRRNFLDHICHDKSKTLI